MNNKNLANSTMVESAAVEYATKTELNVEAHTRAENDQMIDTKLEQKMELIDDLQDKISATQDQQKTSDERITKLESEFLDQIHDLEAENKELTLKLKDINQDVSDKDDELKRLQEEMTNEDATKVNLPFANVPEFEISEVISVKEFINNYLKDLIVSRMKIRYPEARFIKDYIIEIDGLDYNDVMQGKNVLVFVKASENGKLKGECSFEIKVNYNYGMISQELFIEQFLQSAIPVSLREVPEKSAPNYKVLDEIINTKPLKLLLNNKEFKHLPFKIFAEMNAASYWTDFHRDWQDLIQGYVGTGSSTIGKDTVINSIKSLYNATSGYYNYIFKLIEQRLNDSGVKCTVTKKLVKHSRSVNLLHTLGNLTFNVKSANLENNSIVTTQSRHYYIMLNFEVNLNNIKRLYRGVTLVLTDNLELY